MVLGGSVFQRTGEFDGRLAQEVAQLWGGRHDQHAPTVAIARPRVATEYREEKDARGSLVKRPYTQTVYDSIGVPLDESRVSVDMKLDQRRKGLLWYNTYGVTFDGRYTIRNPDDASRSVEV